MPLSSDGRRDLDPQAVTRDALARADGRWVPDSGAGYASGAEAVQRALDSNRLTASAHSDWKESTRGISLFLGASHDFP